MTFVKWLLNSEIASGAVVLVFFMVFFAAHSKATGRDPSAKWLAGYFIASFVAMILTYRFLLNPALRSWM